MGKMLNMKQGICLHMGSYGEITYIYICMYIRIHIHNNYPAGVV